MDSLLGAHVLSRRGAELAAALRSDSRPAHLFLGPAPATPGGRHDPGPLLDLRQRRGGLPQHACARVARSRVAHGQSSGTRESRATRAACSAAGRTYRHGVRRPIRRAGDPRAGEPRRRQSWPQASELSLYQSALGSQSSRKDAWLMHGRRWRSSLLVSQLPRSSRTATSWSCTTPVRRRTARASTGCGCGRTEAAAVRGGRSN